MSGVVGGWDPASPPAAPVPDAATLAPFVALGATPDLDTASLDPTSRELLARLMHVPADAWEACRAELDSAALVALVRVFTVAERQLPGCEVGDDSPVIPLASELRRRGDWPADLRQWIRSRSDNRFLPWGNLLKRL